ncbi:efflux RND transporter periplasmic adaptor subunit [Roseomonas sp. HF4]|uniref:efflux RND transporter periplasmic adaptor subunit n=1 Tax=Roseomonas sp. HF4 TaxID=2562313 RepID=UPI0010C0B977|nr:efflux RND transporter periplasmic adaptor subunit [Roseomonas sp. HF4]
MRRGAWLLALGALVAAAGGYVWMQRGAAGNAEAPVAAQPAAPIGVGALGRVEPVSRIRRLTQPGGMAVTRLDRLLVDEGDRVAEGQLLAEFADAAQRDAAVAQARAALEEAEAALAKTRAAGRASEVAAQRARIAALAAQEDYAQREAGRAERLVPTGAGAVAAADRARAAAVQLAAQKREAEAELDTLLSSRPEDIALAEARAAAARAALQRAAAEAELSRVRAPFAGTVLRVIARPGDQVGSDGLLEIGDLSRMVVVADVYETDLPRLREGAPAEVVVPGEAARFAAVVTEIGWTVRRQLQATTDPVAAVDSRTVEVRLALEEAGSAALRRRSNMQVQVAIRP